MKLYPSIIKRFPFAISLIISYFSIFLFQIPLIAEQFPQKDNSGQLKNEIYNKNLENYILGPGDNLIVEFRKAVELTLTYMIGPDGYLNMPEIGFIMASGFTVSELENILESKFSKSIINPQIRILIQGYRPVKTLVVGEVVKPGFYNLAGVNANVGFINTDNKMENNIVYNTSSSASGALFPTLFDVIRNAGGITLYSDINNIEVIRSNTISNGGGKIRANLNLLSLIQDGDQSQNIRIYDGDTIKINRSEINLGKQIIQARKTNLNPLSINVFVGGNVANPGKILLPNGAGLNQAIELAGGPKLFSGNVVFLRFGNDGIINKKIIKYNQNKNINTKSNPQLEEGDIIQVKDSLLGRSTEALREITSPIVGAYGFYGIIQEIVND